MQLVYSNLLVKRARMRNQRRVRIKEEPSTAYVKINSLAKIVERLTYRLENTERKRQWENQQGPQIKNPNFRKILILQNQEKLYPINCFDHLSRKIMVKFHNNMKKRRKL